MSDLPRAWGVGEKSESLFCGEAHGGSGLTKQGRGSRQGDGPERRHRGSDVTKCWENANSRWEEPGLVEGRQGEACRGQVRCSRNGSGR